MELQEKIDSLSASLKVFFEKLAFEGVLTWSCRWKNWIDRSELTENIIYQEIETLIGNRIKKLEGDELDKNEKIESKYPESLTSPLGNTSRNIFEAVSDDLKEKYKSDKRLIKDIMEDEGYDIKHDSILGDLIAVLHRVSGMSVEKAETERKSTDGDIDEAVSEREDKDKERDKDRDREKEKDKDRERERDREKSGKGGKRDISQLLKSMFALRPRTPEQVFREIQDDCIIKHEEEMKRQKRREDKYIMLLRDFYNRSDHVGFEWEEAKKDLGKYSEYDALSRTDRKRMFHEHMKELEQLMKLKNKSLHDSMTSSEIKNGNGNDEKEMGEISSGGGGRKSDSDHRTSERSSDGKKYRDEREKGKSEFSGRERSREEGEERSKDSERGREKEKQRDERDAEKFDSRKRDRLEGESRDLGAETEEGEENDDEGDKKSKKNRKEKSPKRDKRHKKVCVENTFIPTFITSDINILIQSSILLKISSLQRSEEHTSELQSPC